MGAIAGWIGAHGAAAPEAASVGPVLEALAHRGRGEGGMLALPRGGVLGASPQPLHDAQAGVALALDGEICNRDELRAQLAVRGYELAQGGAAELVLRAYQHWDKDLMKHLRGAFALALWDARKERLLLARDRFGEKPLYLREAGGMLWFASEAKGLAAHPGIALKVDLQSLWDCLLHRYVPGPRTLFQGIRKLAPGGYALWQFGRLREGRYWTPPDREARPDRPPQPEPVAAFIEQLEEAVKLRAHDAPGVFLSAGFDSAALLALAARHRSRIRTFTAGLAGAKSAEHARAARLARHFGAEHHEIVLSPAELAAELPRAVAARDAPLARPSDLAVRLLARAAATATDAVITGDGGDEIVGGYRRHAAERLCASLFVAERRSCWLRWGGALDPGARERLAVQRVDTENPVFDADPRASRLRRMLYFEQSGWLPDHVLERGDRMTMSVSLEAHAPFLDHRLAEHVSALPDALRVRGLATKWIVRQAARVLVPRAVLAPRKAGFGIRAGEWLRGELRECLLDHLRGSGSLTRAYFHAPALDRVLDEHLSGRRQHEELLWTLLNLEIWHRTYRPA